MQAARNLAIADLTVHRRPASEVSPALRPKFDALAAKLSETLAPLAGSLPKLAVDRIEAAAALPEAYESDMYWINARIVADRDGFDVTARIDRNFIFAVCEAAFGGSGVGKPYQEERPFSQVERKLAREIFESIAAAIPAALADTPNASVVFQHEDVAKTSAPAALEAKLLLNAFGYSGELVLGLSRPFVDALNVELAEKPKSAPAKLNREWGERMHAHLENVDVELKIVLAELEIDLRELSALYPGKLIKLPVRLDSPMKVYCEERCLFEANFAQSDSAYTVSVNRMRA